MSKTKIYDTTSIVYGVTSMILPIEEYNRLREIEEKHNKIVEYAKFLEGKDV